MLQADIMQYFPFNLPLFILKGNFYCREHRYDNVSNKKDFHRYCFRLLKSHN